MGVVLGRDTHREEKLKQRIAQLKKQEKKLREERHNLESELRHLVYLRYKRMGEKIGSKIEGL